MKTKSFYLTYVTPKCKACRLLGKTGVSGDITLMNILYQPKQMPCEKGIGAVVISHALNQTCGTNFPGFLQLK